MRSTRVVALVITSVPDSETRLKVTSLSPVRTGAPPNTVPHTLTPPTQDKDTPSAPSHRHTVTSTPAARPKLRAFTRLALSRQPTRAAEVKNRLLPFMLGPVRQSLMLLILLVDMAWRSWARREVRATQGEESGFKALDNSGTLTCAEERH